LPAFAVASIVTSQIDINQQLPAPILLYFLRNYPLWRALWQAIWFGGGFMSTLTIYLARLIGLSAVLLATALLVRGNTLIMATIADGAVMLVYAIFSLAAGLAIILGHNVWSGGTLPVMVTLVGWLIFAKGLVLLLVTPETLVQRLEQMQYGEHYSLYIVPAIIIGLYLTYGGFRTSSSLLKSV
jgi:hypothetical protein